jgi:hypothetical protein
MSPIGIARTNLYAGLVVTTLGIAAAVSNTSPEAQQPPAGRQGGAGRGGQQGPPPTPRAAAPFDLTGYWVSVVTEDWRWRMVTPQKGDYASVPLNDTGRKVADSWDLAKDEANHEECKAFGAAGLIRIPMRLNITWQDDTTLKIETDAGQQTRLLHFGGSPGQAGERTWQGYSAAEWFKQPQAAGLGFGRGGAGRGFAGGNLKVVTTNMKAGYLRKNGVPYSESTVLTEYFNRHDEPNGDQWIMVTSVIEDPTYLNQPFLLSTSFKKEADGSKWRPTPCEIDPPRD